ncbi:hypothetical protein JCM11491_002507 [Sporobolomyces phaffii]
MGKNTTTKAATSSSKKKSKSTEEKEPSMAPYHVFRRERLAELKESEPDLDGPARQKVISAEWKTSDQNPKNHPQEDGEQQSE